MLQLRNATDNLREHLLIEHQTWFFEGDLHHIMKNEEQEGEHKAVTELKSSGMLCSSGSGPEGASQSTSGECQQVYQRDANCHEQVSGVDRCETAVRTKDGVPRRSHHGSFGGASQRAAENYGRKVNH